MTKNFAKTVATLALGLLASCESVHPVDAGRPLSPDLVEGVYLLSAPGETTSSAWETYAVQFEGILNLDQDPLDPTKLIGTVSKFRELDLDGTESITTKISGSIDASRALILEISAPTRGFKWTGRGIVVGSRISGQWQSSGPAAGGFIAERLD